MRRIAMLFDRPATRWTAGAVGALAGAVAMVNLMLVSCEGSGTTAGAAARRRGEAHAEASAKAAPRPSVGGEYSLGGVEPRVRVRILTAAESVPLVAIGGLVIAPADPNPLLAEANPGASSQELGGVVTVTFRAGVWTLTGPRGEQVCMPANTPLVVWPKDGTGVGVIGAVYPGRLRLIPRSELSDHAFDVVEFVEVEDYLPGVVAKELPGGWPAEAYRAQAVGARSYALHERQRAIKGGDRFDLESSDRDQVYAGGVAPAVVRQAVASTRGQVLLWNGALLRAYFSSTCGGRTASAADTWPTGPGFEFNLAAPIQAHAREHACQASPLYRWMVVRDRAELVRRLRAFGEKQGLAIKKIRDLALVEVMALNEDQRASRFRIVEPDAVGGVAYQLSAEEFRVACNTDVAAAAGMAGLPPIERRARVNSSDVEVKMEGAAVIISGRGFGHGVGMCQYCARAFAERGEDWRAMLARFYPGARAAKAY